MGFNRISLGVQDIDAKVQEAVNRIQDPEATLEMVSGSRELGFNSVSIDLIYGLPLQTVESFARGVSVVTFEFDTADDGILTVGAVEIDVEPTDAPVDIVASIVSAVAGSGLTVTPVVYDNLLYVAVGQDPEHGEGIGNMWCLNPAGAEGDVSP